MKASVALGDPCSQPTQLEESMLHPCTSAAKRSYSDGSKAGFTLFILLLFLFPAGEWQDSLSAQREPEKLPV